MAAAADFESAAIALGIRFLVFGDWQTTIVGRMVLSPVRAPRCLSVQTGRVARALQFRASRGFVMEMNDAIE